MKPMKQLRIASHEVLMTDGSVRTLSVVCLEQGRVTACHPLTQELPSTLWFPGRIELRRDEQGYTHAYYEDVRIK